MGSRGGGIDADLGNWPGGFPGPSIRDRFAAVGAGAALGLVLGAPVYVFGVLAALRRERRWVSALRGGHLAVLAYLVTVGASVSFFLQCGAIG